MSRFVQIESFAAVVEAGSFSKAAGRLGTATSSVSRRVADLEARLGVQLLNRTTRSLHLTEAGETFYRRAAAILADLDEAETGATTAQRELRGTLRIAAPVSFGQLHLRPVVDAFLAAHPEIRLEADFADHRIDMIAGGIDVALRIGTLEPSSLIARKLSPIRHLAAAAPAFWETHGRPERPADLETRDCLRYANLPDPETIAFTATDGRTGTVSPRLRLLASNGDVVRDAACSGLGFIVEPSFIIGQAIRDGALEAVLTDYIWSDMSLYVVYPPTRQVSNRVRAFIDAVADRFTATPYWDDGLPLP